ncbi:MAG: ABC transporter permease [Rhodothermales bacterium]
MMEKPPVSPPPTPPRWAVALLRRYAPIALLETTEGDLEELYAWRTTQAPRWRADLWYAKEVVLFCLWHHRERADHPTGHGIMLGNYLTVALRHLRKHAAYTFINVSGLALSLACALLVVAYVQDERSYDRFHPSADRLYRIAEDVQPRGSAIVHDARTAPALLPWLQDEVPGVEAVARVMAYDVLSGATLRTDQGQAFHEPQFLFADSTFFDLFAFPLVAGDAATALDAPGTVVLTEAMARKYFGTTNAIGQTVTFQNDETQLPLTVTGVMADDHAPSHLAFNFVSSFSTLLTLESWFGGSYHWSPSYVYVRLVPGMRPEAVAADLDAKSAERWETVGAPDRTFVLQPVQSIHLTSQRENEIAPNSRLAYVYILSLVALGLLVIACINFMNLATARSMQRAREVGMRKVLGARRGQLIRQFFAESFLLTGLGLLVAVVLVPAVLPAFNAVAGKSLALGDLFTPPMMGAMLALTMGVGLLAGSYPALYLSAFQPLRVLKGTVARAGRGARTFRQGLVIFQFAISAVLLIGTGIIYQQMRYIQTKNLGFAKEQVVVLTLRDAADQQNYLALKADLESRSDVVAVSGAASVPGFGGLYAFNMVPEQASVDSLEVLNLVADPSFAEVFNLKVIAGRDFSEDRPGDFDQAFLVNEALAKRLGWTDPVGQKLEADFHLRGYIRKQGEVVGLVEDFHFRSLHSAVEPVLIHLTRPSYYIDYVAVRLASSNLPATLEGLEAAWARFNPSRPFEYTFLDSHFDALYRSEQQLSQLFGYLTLVTLFIACLGLFGLASFTAEQRTKEIGVRKVLGATVPGLVQLLMRDVLLLVLIAFVVACPVTYVLMQRWLQGFAYHIEPGVLIFLVAGSITFLVAILAVGSQALRAAIADPIHSIRHE